MSRNTVTTTKGYVLQSWQSSKFVAGFDGDTGATQEVNSFRHAFVWDSLSGILRELRNLPAVPMGVQHDLAILALDMTTVTKVTHTTTTRKLERLNT